LVGVTSAFKLGPGLRRGDESNIAIVTIAKQFYQGGRACGQGAFGNGSEAWPNTYRQPFGVRTVSLNHSL
jgi:hypothetical protein